MNGKRGGKILILFGVVVALLTAFLVFNMTKKASAETKIETLDVVVALRDIPERTLIPAEALGTLRIPVDAKPPGAVASVAKATNKMVVAPIFRGEFILEAKLADTKGSSGLAFAIDKGKVLITFPASDIVGTGALRVGDTVDILVSLKPPSQAGPASASQSAESLPSTTQTTMQNLKIVSMGTQTSTRPASAGPNPNSNLITFALDHQDALLLKALKDGEGVDLEVVLRAAGDEEIVTTQPVTMRTIIERYRLRSP